MLNPHDYPLSIKKPSLINTPSGKKMKDINLNNVLSGDVTADDCRISAQTLEYQAQVAESVGNWQIAKNLRRAAELTKIPDEIVLKVYNALRPNRSSKKRLLEISGSLKEKYEAYICADFLKEAAEVYEKKGMLKPEE